MINYCNLRLAIVLLSVSGILLLCAPADADPQPQGVPQQSTEPADASTDPSDAAEESSYNGQDFTRPQRSFETRFRYETSGTTSRTDRDFLMLRATTKVELGGGWKLGLFAQMSLVDKTVTSSEPSSSSTESGVGDSTFQAALIYTVDQHWAWGFGARLVDPTAEDSLGSGKWQIMPGFGVRYSFLEYGPDTYFVPVIRYAMSFAGNPTARAISEPQIAPTLNIGLPDRWFVTFYPSNDIRINYGQPVSGQTGRLFLPFDAAIGRKMTDNLVMSLEASVPIIKDYPVYNFKTEFKVVWNF
jgi:Putative MetA-pathway of phenol degradation